MANPGFNILLIEKEPDISFLIETILKGENCCVLPVDSLSLAKEAILHQGKGIALVIINLNCGGLELIEEIDGDPFPCPVIYTDTSSRPLMPGSELYQKISRFHAHETFDILPMPFERADLITKVNNLLHR